MVLLFLGFYGALGSFRFFLSHPWGTFFGYKEYLILFQNNDELRPGGGFLTAYANLNLLFGVPIEFSFHNSYDVDTPAYVTPPYPHEELLKNEWYQGYTFRDANWDPDFPVSANALVDFYQKKFPDAEIDGMAVINFSAIEQLVEAFAPLVVDDRSVDRQSLFSFLQFEVGNVDRHNVEALAGRKDVLALLNQALMSQVRWHPFKTRRILENALTTKDFYFWFKKPSLQRAIVKKGWGNVMIAPERGDFLGINLANLGSKKADRYLLKNAEYYVDLSSPVPKGHLKVALNFPGKKNSYSDPYKGYLRVLIPSSYSITQKPEGSRVEPAGDFQYLGIIVTMGEDSAAEWTFDWILPRNLLSENEYRLRLFKQSADRTHYLVAVNGPWDAMMESVDFETRENKAFWRGALVGDTDLFLRILPDTTPPYVLEQKFDSLRQITVVWSEPMDPASANDPKRYAITDLNLTTDTTDTVAIDKIETDQAITRLTLSGVTEQPLEQYRLKLAGIHDLSGNAIQPDPKDITVVQRF